MLQNRRLRLPLGKVAYGMVVVRLCLAVRSIRYSLRFPVLRRTDKLCSDRLLIRAFHYTPFLWQCDLFGAAAQ
jgi:hypothetical protein